MNKRFENEIKLPFGSLRFVDGCVIGKFQHGTNVGKSEIDMMIAAIHQHYGDDEFVYISLREEDYSVDPVQIRRLAKELNFKAGAFVIPESRRKSIIEQERLFYRKRETQVFRELDDAIDWAKSIMKTTNSTPR